MYIDPIILQYSLIAAISFCAFMVGRTLGAGDRDVIIADTLEYLVENGFVRGRRSDDELEILKLDHDDSKN